MSHQGFQKLSQRLQQYYVLTASTDHQKRRESTTGSFHLATDTNKQIHV